MLCSKGSIVFQCVDTGHEVCNVKILNFSGTVTQRFTLHSSAAGKGFWKEGNHHWLFTQKLGKTVGAAV